MAMEKKTTLTKVVLTVFGILSMIAAIPFILVMSFGWLVENVNRFVHDEKKLTYKRFWMNVAETTLERKFEK